MATIREVKKELHAASTIAGFGIINEVQRGHSDVQYDNAHIAVILCRTRSLLEIRCMKCYNSKKRNEVLPCRTY